jgi:hypothetical protein
MVWQPISAGDASRGWTGAMRISDNTLSRHFTHMRLNFCVSLGHASSAASAVSGSPK